MTGPYAYDDKNQWLAFDDATSLKIKTKYALLRNLGGVGLYSIDADDVDNHCGNGAFSLIRSIHATLSHLDRRPRQLIVHRYFHFLLYLYFLVTVTFIIEEGLINTLLHFN